MPMSRWLAETLVMSRPSTTIRPVSGSSSPAECSQRGRLATAGRAEQRDQLARRELEGQPVQGLDCAVGAMQVEQLHGDPARAVGLLRWSRSS